MKLEKKLGQRNRLVLGVVADTHGSMPATMANLEHFARVFRQQHVDAVVALGDLGSTEDEIARVLTALGDVGAPILALAGERETEASFHAAVDQARARGLDITDLVDQRIVDSGYVDIVSAPGYPFSDSGCHYDATDLKRLAEDAHGHYRPMVLLAHTPPKGNGPQDVDWSDGANRGDSAMRDLIDALYPNVALFAHADESGGRVTRTWMNVGSAALGIATQVELVDGIPHQSIIRHP